MDQKEGLIHYNRKVQQNHLIKAKKTHKGKINQRTGPTIATVKRKAAFPAITKINYNLR